VGLRLPTRRWPSSLIALLIVFSPLILPAIAGAQGPDPKGEPYKPGDVVAMPAEDEEPRDHAETDELRDPYGVVGEGRHADQISSQVRYVLEGIVVTGNKRTKASTVRKFVPLKQGDFLDPESPELVATEWRLMGTGWFDRVEIHLERGAERGYVVLVVEVKERNTIVIENLIAGLSEDPVTATDPNSKLLPWFGFKITETNLGGRGIRLSGTALASDFQQGGRVDLRYPKLIKSEYGLRFATYFLNGREFYGHSPLVSEPCGMPTCPGTSVVAAAVVRYRRGGVVVGTEKDFTPTLRYSLDWIGEVVSVLDRPEAASEVRGNDIAPIDFAIEDGKSFVSSIQFALLFDKRDDPGITTEGVLFRGVITFGTRFLGSDYDFLWLQANFRRWWKLPWNHSFRLGAFGGAAFGDTPFFYLFHIADLTDLVPSRFLEMMLDGRPPPNLLGTSIENNYLGELAWRLDFEYNIPVYERLRDRGVREVNLYTLIGLFGLADLRDPRAGVSGYSGFSRFPIDLTLDVGFRIDTRVGVFQLGFSTLLGFVRL
jgi:outer membrane protein insertion porin family